MYFINYQLLLPIVTCNLYIINYKFCFFVTCSFRKYSTLDSTTNENLHEYGEDGSTHSSIRDLLGYGQNIQSG